MVGYAANVLLAVIAFRGVIATAPLVVWAITGLSVCAFIGLRSVRKRDRAKIRDDGSSMRSVRSALMFGVLLALPWAILATVWAGQLQDTSEVVLIALTVGMAASGSVLFAPVPVAAVIYVAILLVPLILKCLFVLQGDYLTRRAGDQLPGLSARAYRHQCALVSRAVECGQSAERVRQALSEAREEVERVAMTDGLTGLANRRAFMARLNSLNSRSGKDAPYSIFYLDLDRFKYVNDTLGHAVGDGCSRQAARRMAKVPCARPISSRALAATSSQSLRQNVSDRAPATVIADGLATTLAEPFQLNGQTIQIGASVGVAIASGSRAEGGELLQQADLAMYAAKCAGQGGYCIFEPDMQRLAEERRVIEIGLSSAIANGEFALLYQPIREMATGAITGMECLIRWHHPTHGLLLPAHFLHVAEDIGMANEIGAWVIEEACRQAVKWPSDVVVGVNLSPLQIASGDVMAPIERALKSSGLPRGASSSRLPRRVCCKQSGYDRLASDG